MDVTLPYTPFSCGCRTVDVGFTARARHYTWPTAVCYYATPVGHHAHTIETLFAVPRLADALQLRTPLRGCPFVLHFRGSAFTGHTVTARTPRAPLRTTTGLYARTRTVVDVKTPLPPQLVILTCSFACYVPACGGLVYWTLNGLPRLRRWLPFTRLHAAFRSFPGSTPALPNTGVGRCCAPHLLPLPHCVLQVGTPRARYPAVRAPTAHRYPFTCSCGPRLLIEHFVATPFTLHSRLLYVTPYLLVALLQHHTPCPARPAHHRTRTLTLRCRLLPQAD